MGKTFRYIFGIFFVKENGNWEWRSLTNVHPPTWVANILFSKVVIPWPNYSQCMGDFHIFESWLFFFDDVWFFSPWAPTLNFFFFLQTLGGGKTNIQMSLNCSHHQRQTHGYIAWPPCKNGVHSTPTMCMQGKLLPSYSIIVTK